MEYFDVNKMKEIGRRIKKRRREKSLTQSKLAEELGISTNQMSNIETGNSACKPDHIIQLVQILGISSDYLLFGTEMIPFMGSKELHDENSIDSKIMRLLLEINEDEKSKIYRMISIMLEPRIS